MTPVIEILIVGEEILSGRTLDTNATHMRSALELSGYGVRFISIVGDDIETLPRALKFASERADIVLVTGGLGPTSDDMTVEAAAQAFDRRLVLNEDVLKNIGRIFRKRGYFMSDSNRKQAFIPESAEPLVNPLGTAPGISISVDGGGPTGSGSTVYLMPGVPRECMAMFDTIILPRITAAFKPSKIMIAVVNVAGISESLLYDTVKHLPGAEKALAFYPHYSGIEIRITTNDSAPIEASELRDKIVGLLGDKVFSTAGETMEQAVARLLVDKGVTIALAESCTGGLIAHRLTNIPGSSAYMLCGVVAYSNDSKVNLLGVKPDTIEAHGAVSAETVNEMAEGVRRIAGADIGISTTGIAGPGGATPSKPVGLMFTGLSDETKTHTKKLQFVEDRLINKNRMSQAVLDLLRHHLLTL